MTNSKSKCHWLKDPITLATVVIAIATFMNVVASIFIGVYTAQYTKTTKDIYMASNRPYLGIVSRDIDHVNNRLHIVSHLKNVGNVPATNVSAECITLLDGYKMPDIISVFRAQNLI